MAYSNTNRDKAQPEEGNWLKTGLVVVGLLLITLSSATNLYRQWTTLQEARARNKKLETTLDELTIKNKRLEHQIELATSSAYIDRKARDYFGMGYPEDAWLIMPIEDKDLDIKTKETVIDEKPNILKWWELFTRRR